MKLFKTINEILLLFLYEIGNSNQKKIAQGIGVNRGVVSRILMGLKENSLVKDRLGSVEGLKRKVKIYSLTEHGKKKAEQIRTTINQKKVVLVDSQGKKHIMPFCDIQNFLEEKTGNSFSLDAFFKYLKDDNAIDIEKMIHTKLTKQKFIFSKPKISSFYGRRDELLTIRDFVNGSSKILSIYGPTSIGKSTLVSKALEGFNDERVIFWHKFYEFSTSKSIINCLADLLFSLNREKLKEYVISNLKVDEKETLDILRKELLNYTKKVTFIFDDVHKLSRDYSKFIFELLQMVKGLTQVKVIVIGIWIPCLYDEIDVDQGIINEMVLEGLTWKTIYQLLEDKRLEKIIDNKKLFQKEKLKEIILTKDISSSVVNSILNDLLKMGQYQTIIDILPEIPYTFKQTRFLIDAYLKFHELEKIDSLLQHWKRRLSSVREKILWHYFKNLCFSRQGMQEEALRFLNKGLRLLEKISDQELSVRFSTQLVCNAINQGQLNEASDLLKSLEVLLEEKKDSENEGIILTYRGWILEAEGKLDQALEIYQQTLSLFEVNGNLWYIGNSLNNIASIYECRNQLEIALEYYKIALKIAKHKGALLEIGKTLSNISIIYSHYGRQDLALNHYLKALFFVEKSGNLESIAKTSNNIGMLLYEQGKLDKALTYLNRTLEIGMKISHKQLISQSQLNIGIIYHSIGQFNEAFEYYNQTLEVFEQIGEPYSLSVVLTNLGLLCTDQEKFEQAFSYLERALKLRELLDNPYLIAEVIFNIACIHAKRKTLTDDLSILTRFPSAPYESPITQVYKNMLEALLAQVEESWVEAAKLWKKTLDIKGLAFGYRILCYQNLVELSLRKWLANKSNVNYKSLVKDLNDWESFSKEKNISQGLCQVYLIRGKLSKIEFKFHEAKQLLVNCLAIANERNITLYKDLAEKELMALESDLRKILLLSEQMKIEYKDI